MGQEEAGLDRVWGENMLRAGRYDGVMRLVNQLWGAQEVREIPANLPPPAHTMFVGRETEMARLQIDTLACRSCFRLVMGRI